MPLFCCFKGSSAYFPNDGVQELQEELQEELRQVPNEEDRQQVVVEERVHRVRLDPEITNLLNSIEPEQNSFDPGRSTVTFSSRTLFSTQPSCVVESSPSDYWARKMSENDQVLCSTERLMHGITNVKKLGRGGFGFVFQARWCHVDVAVKFMVTKDVEGQTHEQMAKTEVLLSEGLRHPNIIQTFQTRRGTVTQAWLDQALSSTSPLLSETSYAIEIPSNPGDEDGAQDLDGSDRKIPYDSDDGYGAPDKTIESNDKSLSTQQIMNLVKPVVGDRLTVIIMELADKGALEWAIGAKLFNIEGIPKGSRRWRQMYRAIIRTMREVAQGVSALHDLDIIHCDLKPCNLLLKSSRTDVRGFTAKVCDFGLSKVEPMLGPDYAEKACGTLLYMAPERLNGSVCKASDIYSLGVILFEIATGIEPYSDMHSRDIVDGVSKGSLRPVWPAEVMPELQPLYARCSEHDPAKRPTARQVVHQLIDIESALRTSTRISPASVIPGHRNASTSNSTKDVAHA